MTSTNLATSNVLSQTGNAGNRQSGTATPLTQLLKATSTNDFAAAQQILNDNPASKNMLLTSLSKSDPGAVFRLSNSAAIASSGDIAGTSATSKVLIAGKTTSANIEINMGKNYKPDIFENTARLFGNNNFRSYSSDNQVARYVAKTQFGILVKGQLDGSGTISLPNTRAGGEILAKIQTTSVGFSGMGIEGSPWLKIPKGASKEFMAGFNDVATKAGWAALGNAATTIGGGAIGARSSRPNVNMGKNRENSSVNVMQRVKLSGESMSYKTTWRVRTENPQEPKPWNSKSLSDGSGNDCNWCTLEIFTGVSRINLSKGSRPISPNGIKPGEQMSPTELKSSLKTAGLVNKSTDYSKTEINGSFDVAIAAMKEYPAGKVFALRYEWVNGGAHTVAAVKQANGDIKIYDGAANTTYDINLYRQLAPEIRAYPLDNHFNQNLN